MGHCPQIFPFLNYDATPKSLCYILKKKSEILMIIEYIFYLPNIGLFIFYFYPPPSALKVMVMIIRKLALYYVKYIDGGVTIESYYVLSGI